MDGITDTMDMNLSKLWEMVKGREAWHAPVMGSHRVGHNLVTEQYNIIIQYNTNNTITLYQSVDRHLDYFHILSMTIGVNVYIFSN